MQVDSSRKRALVRESDRLLYSLEELNWQGLKQMSRDLAVEIFTFLLQCDIKHPKKPTREVHKGQHLIFKAQASIFGCNEDEEGN